MNYDQTEEIPIQGLLYRKFTTQIFPLMLDDHCEEGEDVNVMVVADVREGSFHVRWVLGEDDPSEAYFRGRSIRKEEVARRLFPNLKRYTYRR